MFAQFATTSRSHSKVDEEMQSLQLDRPTGGKSATQMQRHTVDEQLQMKPIERSLYILTKGDDLQKLSVIQSLPDLLNIDNQATITRIIPKIQQELPTSSSEFHIATSHMFRLLIEMRVSLNLIRPVIQGVESKDTIVAAAWIETLISVVPFMNEAILKNEVLPFVTKMTNLNRSLLYRTSSCKLLGLIALHPKVNPFEVKRDILPLVQSLCQDCMFEVRAAMCAELPDVAEGLSNEVIIKASLLPCLVELSSDENVTVRSAAVCSVAVLIPFLSSDTIKATIVPLVQKLCLQSISESDQTFPSVARVYGTLLTNLQPHLSEQNSVWFLQFVKQLSQKGLNEKEDFEGEPTLVVRCREHCADNLPAITYFMTMQIPTELSKWTVMFKALAGDPCYLVRKMVAGNIHEVAKILRKDCKIIVTDFIKLLRDESEEVLDALVPNISKALEVFTVSSILSRDATTQSTLEVGRALLKCQIEVFKWHNWRRMMVFLQQLEHLPFYMPADFIHQHFTPVILKLILEARARPVRAQAARTILYFLRYCTKDNHRRWIRDNLVNLVCRSQSCYTRHIFIMMCSDAIEIFSWKYFKEHFFAHLLSLGEDPVSTVRLCVVNMCPTLRQMLNLPLDKNLQGRLEGIMTKLEMMERDRDVIAALKAKLKDMRSVTMYHSDALQVEKRKQEEEEKILQGRSFGSNITGRSIRSPQSAPQPTQLEPSTTSPRQKELDKSERSRGLQYPPNHMTFLHKHFYTDAGVLLPQIEPDQSLDEGLSELTLSTPIADPEANLTDDLKANLRRIGGGEVTMRKNKRNSCTFPSQRTEARNVKRYSLNVNLEGSRIPVRSNSKGGGVNETKENRPASKGNVNNIAAKASNLPVLRKSFSDFKKYNM